LLVSAAFTPATVSATSAVIATLPGWWISPFLSTLLPFPAVCVGPTAIGALLLPLLLLPLGCQGCCVLHCQLYCCSCVTATDTNSAAAPATVTAAATSSFFILRAQPLD
jgi:hypothetical protein